MTARPRARPRFTLDLAIAPDQVLARVRSRLADDPRVHGKLFRRGMLLTVRPEDAHFWSPQLDVQLDDAEGGGTRLSALFAPHPQIWTTFVAVQILFGILSLCAAIYLLSVYLLGSSPFVAWITLIAFLIGGGLAYGAAYVGQGFGSEQMYELRSFLDHALEL